MKQKRNKRISVLNLIAGYICAMSFFILIALNIQDKPTNQGTQTTKNLDLNDSQLFDGSHDKEIVYLNTHGTNHTFIRDNDIAIDRLRGITIDDPNVIVRDDRAIDDVTVFSGPDHVIIDRHDRDLVIDETFEQSSVVDITGDSVISGVHRGHSNYDVDHKDHLRGGVDKDVDHGLLDRRLRELEDGRNPFEEVDLGAYDRAIREDKNKIGIKDEEQDINLANLTLAREDGDAELGDIDLDFSDKGGGYGVGKGGELYAYNFPSLGVGAGIGSSAIGAGAGGGAGLGAGIGEGMLNGETVPTLGGVGTGSPPLSGQAAGTPSTGGVGGLVGGAGAGGAAGLTQGYIIEELGMGVGKGMGAGNAAGYGGNRGYNYNHLPKDGALHIMMHVDGSGSILNTRKQLDIMKETILKDALLPYYNNDESLYNNRVTIVSSSGERTLKFFAEAAKKDNVLAIAFQDEAQPAYHLPNFNKKPEDHYIDDIGKLKSSLNGYNGVYRGVMFQVDRGNTFAKSFKEFVGNAFRGEGYLQSSNLKKYYRDNNNDHIKNKDGIVFSDEYHAKDSGDPQYYMNLILQAAKRIGINLESQGGGLTDGKYHQNK